MSFEPVPRLVLHAKQPLKLLGRVGAVRRDLAVADHRGRWLVATI
jgi:hypothetical protein